MPRRLKQSNLTQQRNMLADTQEYRQETSTLDTSHNTSQESKIVDSSLVTSQDKTVHTTTTPIDNSAPALNTLTSLAHIESELPTRRNGQPLTEEERITAKRVFLEEFATQANVTMACERAGISRTTAYTWLDNDSEFASQWTIAEQKANHVLIQAAYDRGVHGVSEPVVSMGKLVRDETTGEPLTVKRYSDNILMMLMRAKMPEYRDSKHVDINQNTNIHMTQHSLTLDLRGMNADELAQVRAIADGMKQREQARLEQAKDKGTGEHTA